MGPSLGDQAPNFVAETTSGLIDFHRWKRGSWAMLFSYPAAFTPVCTTELAELARLRGEFDRRNTKVIGLSVDPVATHDRWAEEIEELHGVKLGFPLIGDSADGVATRYGMIHDGADPAVTARTVFLVDRRDRIRLILAYPLETGRNFVEVLRAIESLQRADAHGVWTPANWRPTERVLVSPAIDDETAHERFGSVEAQRPYLRYVEDPGPAPATGG